MTDLLVITNVDRFRLAAGLGRKCWPNVFEYGEDLLTFLRRLQEKHNPCNHDDVLLFCAVGSSSTNLFDPSLPA